jgi:hypothetical protein
MIADPVLRGRTLGAFFQRLEPALWGDVLESGLLAGTDEARARAEWECFALYACVRGLVAAGGFGEDNARAIDALHDVVAEAWLADPGTFEDTAARRARVSARYEEYGGIGQAHEARGDDVVTARLGEAAARHVSGTDIAHVELGIMLGELHEAIAHGAAESVRAAET